MSWLVSSTCIYSEIVTNWPCKVTFETKDGVQQEGVYICPGEVFCRVPRCLVSRELYTKPILYYEVVLIGFQARCDSTTNLRKHVGKHQGYVVAPGKDGAMSVAARDIAQSKKFYSFDWL